MLWFACGGVAVGPGTQDTVGKFGKIFDIIAGVCKEHCYKKKAASVRQNGRLSASCNFFSF